LELQNIFLYIFGFALIGWAIMFPILLLTVGRKFDKLFKDRKPAYDPCIPIYSAGLRANLYAGCCIFKIFRKAPQQTWLYGDYDFKKASTKFDKIISLAYYLILLIAGISVFLYYMFAYVIPFISKVL